MNAPPRILRVAGDGGALASSSPMRAGTMQGGIDIQQHVASKDYEALKDKVGTLENSSAVTSRQIGELNNSVDALELKLDSQSEQLVRLDTQLKERQSAAEKTSDRVDRLGKEMKFLLGGVAALVAIGAAQLFNLVPNSVTGLSEPKGFLYVEGSANESGCLLVNLVDVSLGKVYVFDPVPMSGNGGANIPRRSPVPTPAPPENGRFVPPWDLTEPPQQGKPDKAAADKFLRFKDEVVAKVKGLVGEEPTDAVNGTLPLQTEEGAYWELSEVKNLLVAELIEEFGQPTVVALDVELQRIDSADDIRRHLMTHPYGSGWCRSLPDFAMLDD